jgi:hypothetical protein
VAISYRQLTQFSYSLLYAVVFPFAWLYCSEAEAEAYCRQPTGMLNPGVVARWDPWPYIRSVSRPLFFFPPFIGSVVQKSHCDCRSISLGVVPHLGLMTRYLLLFDSYGLAFWGGLSDEKMGLPFVYAAGPRQRSLSRVRVPWDS